MEIKLIFFINIKTIQNIIDKENDSNPTNYQNKVKLFDRIDKELKGIHRIFLKILKNDIRELEPIESHNEELEGKLKEYKIHKKIIKRFI